MCSVARRTAATETETKTDSHHPGPHAGETEIITPSVS
jgi:hypothetical protein